MTKNHWPFALVGILASVAIIIFTVWAFRSDLLLSYGDATSHLAISRRVIDNLTPGFGQLGSSWLPALHLLLLPFIWYDPWWQNGLAGSIVSGLAFIGASLYGLRLARLLIGRTWLALAVTIVLFANPNLLYLSVTAMNETLFIFSVLAATVHLLLWQRRPGNYTHLLLSGCFAFLSAFNRYEAWFLVIALTLIVFTTGLKKQQRSYALGSSVIFAYLAFAAPLAWLGWNLMIFGNPLFFLHNDFTSRGSQILLEEIGRLPTKGSSLLAVTYFYRAMVHMLGFIAPIFAAAVSFVLLVSSVGTLRRKEKYQQSNDDLTILTLLVPALFIVYTLYRGITALHLPEVFPYAYYNIRYGLFAFPAVFALSAIFIREMKSVWRPLATYTLLILAVGNFLLWPGDWPALTEAEGNPEENQIRREVASYIYQNHAPGELILLSVGAPRGNPLIQRARLPMHTYIHEGTQNYWQRTLANPSAYAAWLVVTYDNDVNNSRDAVMRRISQQPQLLENYDLKFSQDGYRIYRRKG